MKKLTMFVVAGLTVIIPFLAGAQPAPFGPGQLTVTQLEMRPDPVRNDQEIAFRGVVVNNSRRQTRVTIAVMDNSRIVTQAPNVILRPGNNVIDFQKRRYDFGRDDRKCLSLEVYVNRRWLPLQGTQDFCAMRTRDGWSMYGDTEEVRLQVENLRMIPDPVSPGQELRFIVTVRNNGRPSRGNIRIQDRDQIVVQTDQVNIPRGTTEFQLPGSRYGFQRMDTCFRVSVDIDRTIHELDAQREYCAQPTAWTLRPVPRRR